MPSLHPGQEDYTTWADDRVEYVSQPAWVYVQRHKGWVGVPITAAEEFAQPYRAPAAEDFAQPHTPTLEELLEELI